MDPLELSIASLRISLYYFSKTNNDLVKLQTIFRKDQGNDDKIKILRHLMMRLLASN